MQTATKTMEKIKREATKHSADPVDCSVIRVGDVVRQGDLYLVRVSDDTPVTDQVIDRQLAPGTSQGSRHIASAPAEVYESRTGVDGVPQELIGPMVQSRQEWDLLHPEHSDLVQIPAGVYQSWYQRDCNAEEMEEVRRVQD